MSRAPYNILFRGQKTRLMYVKPEGSVSLSSTSTSQTASGALSNPRMLSSSTTDVISTQVFSGASTEDATAWLAYFLQCTRLIHNLINTSLFTSAMQ